MGDTECEAEKKKSKNDGGEQQAPPPDDGMFYRLPDVPDATTRSKVIFSDGRTYEGQWVGNQRHGDGVECSENDDFQYSGQFRGDLYCGFGRMNWSNGSSYVGNFKDGQKHGFGCETYESGDVFRGTFRNGKVHGMGTITFKESGKSATGEWVDGILQGGGEEGA